ncbi:MAG: hypothetical protein QM791_04565 [Ferruginibacter sp.]
MKQYLFICAMLFCYCRMFTACSPTPEKYFDVAVLNSNMVVGFGDDGFSRLIASPSVKLVEGTKDQTAPMKHIEMINDRTVYLEETLKKLKGMGETDDSKDILQNSIALHEYIIPVCKTEYTELAKLYDENAPKEKIDAATKNINDKYYPRFNELYEKLIASGKTYATKHNIKVNWAM